MKSTAILVLASALGATANPVAGPYAYAYPSPQTSPSNCDPTKTTTALGMGKQIPLISADIPTGCSDFEVLIARGTSEQNRDTVGKPAGKFGIVVGDPLIDALVKIMPNARGYPVQYPAGISTNSSGIGATDVLKRLAEQDKACPNQKFALVGYSQGAGVMHAAAGRIPDAIQAKILALVMYGDPAIRTSPFSFGNLALPSIPKFSEALAKKTLENCAPGDPVCGDGTCFDPHLKYGRPQYVNPSAEFIAQAFKGTPMSPTVNRGGADPEANAPPPTVAATPAAATGA